ncbi:MAG: nucleotide exchange factor GrpE [Candidatus Shikimatogenerans bostrichidophilus]|nr:MAG: nucleotide exchange factor GrpE [Candidatus Shikimatogenerans bostrichidophilus]
MNKIKIYKKKNKKLKNKIKIYKIKYKNKLNLLEDKFVRTLAEFDNFKKRTEREKKDLFIINKSNIINNFLPILDDFDRLIKEEKITEKKGIGIYLIYKKLKKILEAHGLKKIDTKIGDDFNLEYHYAISQRKDKKEMKNKIIQILEKGYYIDDKILRCTKVIVGS